MRRCEGYGRTIPFEVKGTPGATASGVACGRGVASVATRTAMRPATRMAAEAVTMPYLGGRWPKLGHTFLNGFCSQGTLNHVRINVLRRTGE